MKFFQKGELKLLFPFYLDSLISPILYFAPAFFVIYFNDLGLSIFKISILMAMMGLFSLIFEIPTGAIADLYGRKISVLIGLVIVGLGFLALFFVTNYYTLLAIFALIGFGATFSSGAKEAWVTDLIKNKRKDFLHRYFVKSQSFDSLGLVVSGFLGAIIVKLYGISIIWLIAASSYAISFFILAFGKEYFVSRKQDIKNSFKQIKIQAVKSVSYSRKHHILFYFLIASSIYVLAASFGGQLSWVPFLRNIGFPDHAFGYMWSAMAIVGVFAPLIGSKFYKKKKERKFIIISLIMMILISFSVLFVKEMMLAFSIFLGILFFDYVKKPVTRVYFHRFIPDKIRASVGSVEVMLLALVGTMAVPLAGLTVDIIGPRYTIFLAGILLIPAVIVYYKIKDVKKV